MQAQERTRIHWTPLKVIGAIVVGALAVFGLLAGLWIAWFFFSPNAGFTW